MNAPLIKPSDARSWSLCHRRVWFDNQPGTQIESESPFETLIMEMGLEHEQDVYTRLSKTLEISTASSVEDTQTLMESGVDLIYQGQLQDLEDGIIGNPDFLIRNQTGDYQAADAKLARNEDKKEIQVQLGLYRRLLDNALPGIVYRGDGSEAYIDDTADTVVDQFIEEMRAILSDGERPVVRYSHSKCYPCPYYTHCRSGFEKKSDTSLLYGIRGSVADALEDAGITTIDELAGMNPEAIPDIPHLKGIGKRSKAVQQAKSILTGEIFSLSEILLPAGTWVHFDIEDNPLTKSGEKCVYLWGFLKPEYETDDYEYIWIDSESEDFDGWNQFLELIERYRTCYPDLVLVHFSPYEKSIISLYAIRYDMENHETVQFLLGDESPLFDIQKPVKSNLVLPLDGLGLKDICKHPDLVNFQWGNEESGSLWSVVQFNAFINETDNNQRQELKNAILGYNQDDVRATRALEIWLRENFVDS